MAETWRNKRDSKDYQPDTFHNYLKKIFSHLHKEGINYDYIKDFTGANSWQAIHDKNIKNAKKEDPKFGTQPNKAEYN